MNNQKTTTNPSNQIRWVILLLAIAVILPTVCLLYFMAQAAENDRLAMRQKMIDFYTKKINEVFPIPSEPLEFAELSPNASLEHIALDLRRLELSDANINHLLFEDPHYSNTRICSYVIYDSNDIMVHPVLEEAEIVPAGFDEVAERAYQLEFQDVNIPAAIEEYTRIDKDSKDDRIKFAAKIATVRCLEKMGKNKEAVELATKLSYLKSEKIPRHLSSDILNARVLLAGLLAKKDSKESQSQIKNLAYKTLLPQTHYTSETRAWALRSINKYIIPSIIIEDPFDAILPEVTKNVIELEDMAVSAAEIYPNPEAFKDWSDRTYRQIQSDPLLYGIHFGAGGNHFLRVLSKDNIAHQLRGRAARIKDEMIFFRIYDDRGELIAGEPRLYRGTEVQFGNKFFEIVPGENYPDWKVEFYFHSGTFSDAAKRQKLIYLWTGILLTSLILIVSSLAGKSILKQATLNTLKNDFIATVTHELKTPLASMRVLVDTLLEGSYNDQRQAVEYLQLISKENKRLTGLIDNFLTFSRMERNKQAFDIVNCPAADIVNDAAAAVKTKFSEKNCRFSVTIGDNIA
ncbi:MAG: hypothetical protein K9M75_13310, partial [Phycisphaerae bacterium]|nr:hypothetical protein [Phycisphaerae bacterium]